MRVHGRIIRSIGLALGLAGLAAGASGQGFPVKAVRLVVPLAPGGNVDLVARALAQRMGEALGQQVIVENRPGASSLVGTQLVARAAPDGYTLLAMANTFATAPHLVVGAGYDPVRDFIGVSQTALLPQVLVVNPSLPARNVRDLVALARARPDDMTYASAGTGSTTHIAGVLFNQAAGIRTIHVPYKGNAPGLVDVIGGQVTMMFDTISTSLQYVRAGRLRALGVTSVTRSPLLPQVPTVAEQGLPGYEAAVFNGLMVPAGTPREIAQRLHAEVARAARAPEVRDRFLQQGVELIPSESPEHFTEFVRAQVARYAKLVRDAGIKPE